MAAELLRLYSSSKSGRLFVSCGVYVVSFVECYVTSSVEFWLIVACDRQTQSIWMNEFANSSRSGERATVLLVLKLEVLCYDIPQERLSQSERTVSRVRGLRPRCSVEGQVGAADQP